MTTRHPKTDAATPRLDEIERAQQGIITTQKAILAMLGHLTNNPESDDKRDPLIHVRAGEERWNICLSQIGKWIAGIMASVITASMIAGLALAWNGAVNMQIMLDRLDKIEARLDRLGKYVGRVDAKLDGKADKP